MEKDLAPIDLKSANNKIGNFFIDQLNIVFCAKAHRVERLQEIVDHPEFADLKDCMNETIKQLEKEIKRLTEIFSLLKLNHSFKNCPDIVSILDGAFISLQRSDADKTLRNLFITAYLLLAKSIEINSFKLLSIAANELHYDALQSLVNQNTEAAVFDNALFIAVSKNL
jgi:ferritin-like metal-binding protein YciE